MKFWIFFQIFELTAAPSDGALPYRDRELKAQLKILPLRKRVGMS